MTPFVVAGMPRTGSSLVLLSLAAHPQIRVFGELFHPWASPRPGAGPAEDDRFDESLEDALAFLDRAVWPLASAGRPVVGFKLFVSHTRSRGAQGLFERLCDHVAGLRVIHCYRPNYLDVWVSLKKAEASGVWAQARGASPPPPVRALSPAARELESFFAEMEGADALLRSLRPRAVCQVVEYEDLASDYAAVLGSLWRFLGVPALELSPPLEKQNVALHSDFLDNHAALQDHFAGTRFARFFGAK